MTHPLYANDRLRSMQYGYAPNQNTSQLILSDVRKSFEPVPTAWRYRELPNGEWTPCDRATYEAIIANGMTRGPVIKGNVRVWQKVEVEVTGWANDGPAISRVTYAALALIAIGLIMGAVAWGVAQ